MSQPPLSEHIKALEDELGAVLFRRHRAGVHLATAGQAILPQVGQLITQLQLFEQGLSETLTGATQVLRVGAISQAMTHILPSWQTKLAQMTNPPSLNVTEIGSGQALSMLERGEIDAALVRARSLASMRRW